MKFQKGTCSLTITARNASTEVKKNVQYIYNNHEYLLNSSLHQILKQTVMGWSIVFYLREFIHEVHLKIPTYLTSKQDDISLQIPLHVYVNFLPVMQHKTVFGTINTVIWGIN